MSMLQRSSLVVLVTIAASSLTFGASPATAEPSAKDVIKTYADIAQAGYTDALVTAKTMKLAIDAFLAKPTNDNLIAARAAWIAARQPYMQTAAYRFGNSIVDDWEGRVNSWPLDEGLIDYVAGAYGSDSPENELYAADVIANASLTIGGKKVNTAKLTKELLSDTLQEAGGVEANVATGYHAIEFLLWGQDLNGTGPGNGNRPASDYNTKKCTGGHCDRRYSIFAPPPTCSSTISLGWRRNGPLTVRRARPSRMGAMRRGSPRFSPGSAVSPMASLRASA